MGGKGGGGAAPPPVPDTSDQEAQMQQMMQMMMMMAMMSGQAGNAASPAPPQIDAAPEIRRSPVIDWKEKQASLKARARADFEVDKDGRKGRTDTSHTSPLLDDEDPITTASLLTDPAPA